MIQVINLRIFIIGDTTAGSRRSSGSAPSSTEGHGVTASFLQKRVTDRSLFLARGVIARTFSCGAAVEI